MHKHIHEEWPSCPAVLSTLNPLETCDRRTSEKCLKNYGPLKNKKVFIIKIGHSLATLK